MPIYDYSCTACAHLVEVIHGMSEPGPRFCPTCGAEGTMRKGFATPAVHYKGSGWAKKDRSATSSSGSSRGSKAGQSTDGKQRSSDGSEGAAAPDAAAASDAGNRATASGKTGSAEGSRPTSATPTSDGGA